MQWFRLYDDMLDDPKVQRLPPDEFKSQLFAAFAGRSNEFSRFVRPGSWQDLRPPYETWLQIRAVVFKRDDYTCQYCGVRGGRLQCDHIIPLSRVGSNEMNNLATACRDCNQSKSDKTPEEWRAKNAS